MRCLSLVVLFAIVLRPLLAQKKAVTDDIINDQVRTTRFASNWPMIRRSEAWRGKDAVQGGKGGQEGEGRRQCHQSARRQSGMT